MHDKRTSFGIIASMVSIGLASHAQDPVDMLALILIAALLLGSLPSYLRVF